MKSTILALAALLLTTPALAQTNPCTTATTGTEMFSSTATMNLYTELPEHTVNEADGLPRVTDYQLAYFLPTTGTTAPATATPVVPAVTVAKTALTPVAGAANCYTMQIQPVLWTGTWPLVAGLKARRAARTGVEGAESAYALSNPFATAPAALATPGQLRIRQK